MLVSMRKIVAPISVIGLIAVAWIGYFSHESTAKAAAWEKAVLQQNERTPLLVNRTWNLWLRHVSIADGNGVVYDYEFANLNSNSVPSKYFDPLIAEVRSSYCNNQYRYWFEEVGGVKFRYFSNRNDELFSLRLHPDDCHP